MTQTWRAALVLGLVEWTACATTGGIADVAFSVSGQVDRRCLLELFQPGQNDPLDTATVEGAFLKHYGVAPGRYYVALGCDGTQVFRSPVYSIHSMRYLRQPIDLGRIAVPAKQSSPG